MVQCDTRRPRIQSFHGYVVRVAGIPVEFVRADRVDSPAHGNAMDPLRAAFERACAIAAWGLSWMQVARVVAVATPPGATCDAYAITHDDDEEANGWSFLDFEGAFLTRDEAEFARQDWCPEDILPSRHVVGVTFLWAGSVGYKDGLHMGANDWPLHPPGHPNEALNFFCCNRRHDNLAFVYDPTAVDCRKLPVLDCPRAWRLDIEGREHWLVTQRRPHLERVAREKAAMVA